MNADPSELDSLRAKPDLSLLPVPNAGDTPAIPSPPSCIHIYFHIPVTPKDSMLTPYASAVPVDLSTPRALPRDASERELTMKRMTSWKTAHCFCPLHVWTILPVTPCVGESTSEGDWLMAAIGEGSNDGDGPDVSHPPPHDSHVVNGKLYVLYLSPSCGRLPISTIPLTWF